MRRAKIETDLTASIETHSRGEGSGSIFG